MRYTGKGKMELFAILVVLLHFELWEHIIYLENKAITHILKTVEACKTLIHLHSKQIV